MMPWDVGTLVNEEHPADSSIYLIFRMAKAMHSQGPWLSKDLLGVDMMVVIKMK